MNGTTTMTMTSAEEASDPNISEWIMNALADLGVRVVYGGHGGALVPLVNAVCSHPNLTWVCARNEHDAAEMAAAHAKLTGNLGVVIATSGPGATNLVTGLMEGLLDRVPMLAITGMKPTAQLGYAEFQDVNQGRLFAGAGIEWSKDAANPAGVIPLLRDAVTTAITKRTCAHLAIPVDIQGAPSPLHLKPFCAKHSAIRAHPPNIDKDLIQTTAKALVGDNVNNIPRNIIAVGLRATEGTEDVGSAITELAEALNAPILTRLDAMGVIDELHPLCFGVIGVHGKPGMELAATLVSSSDRVICIGVDDETLLVTNVAGLQVRKVVEIEPDAFGLTTRFDADYTLVGSITEICKDLAIKVEMETTIRNRKAQVGKVMSLSLHHHDSEEHALKDATELDKYDYMVHQNPTAVKEAVKTQMKRHSRMSSEFEAPPPPELRRYSTIFDVKKISKDAAKLWKLFHTGNWQKISKVQNGVKYLTDLSVSGPGYCHPAAVMNAISLARRHEETDPASRNATVCVDVGDVTLWSSLSLSLAAGSRTLYSERLGTMGYALNAAVAAVLARPAPASALVLAGDGGFQMSLQELATFQQHRRPGDKLLCIIFDNQVLGRVAFGFDNALGCEFAGPDYVKMAQSFGGDGALLNATEDAKDVVDKAMEADGLYLIHVLVDPTVKADMVAFKDNSLEVMNSG